MSKSSNQENLSEIKVQTMDGYKQTEVGVIPEDWEVKELKYLVDKFVNGGTPSTQKEENWKGKIPWITGADILNQKIGFVRRYITREAVKNRSTNIIKKGKLLLVSRTGVGKLAIAPYDIAVSQDFTGVYNNIELLDASYLFWFFNFAQRVLLEQNQGTSIQGITRDTLSSIKIPLPPTRAEQTAIATALSDMDALIEGLEKLLVKKRNIKQGAMQELLKPKDGWEVKTLGEIGKTYSGLSGKSKSDFETGTKPYIPFMNVMNNPIIDISYFDYVKINSDENQNKANKGDLFFNTSSETPEEVGMCSVLLNDVKELYLNSFCFGFRFYKETKYVGLYLSYFFRSSYGREKLFLLAQGATRYNLSKSNFLKLELELPTPKEQTRIAQILSDMDTEIEKLETQLSKYKMLKTGMMQELLTGKKRLV